MISARVASDGINLPPQWGQSVPHPRPDFVARTRPPMATRTTVATVEAIASRRNRFMYAGDVTRPRYPRARATLGHMSVRKFFAPLIALALFAAACGSDEPASGDGPEASSSSPAPGGGEVFPLFVSSEIVVGDNRFLVGLIDDDDAPIADPKVKVDIAFFDLAESDEEAVSEIDTDFVWTIKPVRGLWVGTAHFDTPGTWGAAVTVGGGGYDETVTGNFKVTKKATTPAIGDPVPASDTPTIDEVDDVSEISTDSHPDLDFYKTSVAEAVDSGKPFVLAFATPKFCTSQVCGPTLDVVKEVSTDFPGVTFIHVEPYELEDIDPNNLKPVPSVQDWGLPSEPWVFLVDADGRLAAKFEGTVGAAELRAALKQL